MEMAHPPFHINSPTSSPNHASYQWDPQPSPSFTSTPALASSTGARGRDQPGKSRVLVRVRVAQGASLTSGVRVDSGASWYWGGLTRKRMKQWAQLVYQLKPGDSGVTKVPRLWEMVSRKQSSY